MLIDPQHRLFLETAWRAVEHSGTAPSALSGTRTGVFIGLGTHDYLGLISEELSHDESKPTWQSARRLPLEPAGSVTGWGFRARRCQSIRPAVPRWSRSTRRPGAALRRMRLALAGGVNVLLNANTV